MAKKKNEIAEKRNFMKKSGATDMMKKLKHRSKSKNKQIKKKIPSF